MGARIWLNVVTEEGELLERVEVEVSDDRLYPIGNSAMRAAIMAEVESAARIVQARARANP